MVEQADDVRMAQQRCSVAYVRMHHAYRAVGGAGHERAAVYDGDLVAVHVGDSAVRCEAVDDLVDVVWGGEPGADIEELAHAFLGGQVTYGAGEELPILAGSLAEPRHDPDQGLGRLAVGGEGVLTADQVVVDAGGVGNPRIDPLSWCIVR
ncbi:hypothetical protein Misp02_23210 [Microtetraspora sp. NBRC 16547]|nr:hypothetical protein Misp02_23210 [Microtetraspora sp. NBRC 16547]